MVCVCRQEAVLEEGTMGGHSKTLISLGYDQGSHPKVDPRGARLGRRTEGEFGGREEQDSFLREGQSTRGV